MRIAIAGISHETNTYCRDETELAEFEIERGAKILRARGNEIAFGGALQACDELDAEIVPIVVAGTQPSGTIARDAYESMAGAILEGLRIDVTQYDFVALKSSNHFRAGFDGIAGTMIITADSPGLTTHHLEIFPRASAARPLWPVDADADYRP